MDLRERIPELELMDDPVQAEAYAETDFSEPHQAFVTHFSLRFPGFEGTEVLDLGCGTADVTARFARAYPRVRVLGVDGAGAMLACGQRLLRQQGLTERVKLQALCLPDPDLLDRRFDAIISNSLLHHLADPAVLWQALRNCSPLGAPLFVMDLLRPRTTEMARALVQKHSGDASARLQEDFYRSLQAAYRPEEVRAQLAGQGLAHLSVEVVSDRHLVVWGRH